MSYDSNIRFYHGVLSREDAEQLLKGELKNSLVEVSLLFQCRDRRRAVFVTRLWFY
jgi:hypothetical protein